MGSLRTGGSLRFHPGQSVDISNLRLQQKDEGTEAIKTNPPRGLENRCLLRGILPLKPSASSASSAFQVLGFALHPYFSDF
jgi:hypothetical protein